MDSNVAVLSCAIRNKPILCLNHNGLAAILTWRHLSRGLYLEPSHILPDAVYMLTCLRESLWIEEPGLLTNPITAASCIHTASYYIGGDTICCLDGVFVCVYHIARFDLISFDMVHIVLTCSKSLRLYIP